jgi:cysteine desulfurase
VSAVVYLDNAATTPVDPRVIEIMLECCGPDGDFANPSAVGHEPGRRARSRVEQARAEVARLVGATPEQIVWTSGATEADNLALFGAARFHRSRGRHIVTSRTEHPAVLDPCRQLEREGFEVTYLKPGADGIVDPGQVAAALRDDTILVSLMHVNNEIGVVQDIGAVGRACRARGVLLHVDAAQSAGKLPIDVERDCVDLLALTAHKVHGPKGVGALCVRREPRLGLVPLLYGGGQERGLRSGTVPTHQVAGMGRAFAIAAEQMAAEATRIGALRERLWAALAALPGLRLNGHPVRRVAGILSVTVDGVEGESLLQSLPDLAVASGSACASTNAEPSYVLRALGHSDRLAQSTLRLSLGRFTTCEHVDYAAGRVRQEVERLRAIAPPGVGAGQR